MEYIGKMYGKLGNKYFQLPKTALDFDNAEKEIEQLKADKEELFEVIKKAERHHMGAHSEIGILLRQTLEKHGK